MLLIAAMLTQIPTIARPLAATIAATFLLCGGLYATSHERLNYIHLDGPEAHATLPSAPRPHHPRPLDSRLRRVGPLHQRRDPRQRRHPPAPRRSPVLFRHWPHPAVPRPALRPHHQPLLPAATLDQARAHNIRWLIVTRSLQLTEPTDPDLSRSSAPSSRTSFPTAPSPTTTSTAANNNPRNQPVRPIACRPALPQHSANTVFIPTAAAAPPQRHCKGVLL